MINPILTRTQVVSFLFIDLVDFSKESTATQHQNKTVLIQYLVAALSPIPVSEYRLRDTGSGAFVAFGSNPEFALYTALALWQACDADNGLTALTRQRLRVGLHIGTVKETPDVEGRINYVGDGINAAKRIQDLAEPGQTLASRSFFDAFDQLDTDYALLFNRCGSGDDRQGRSYELFSLSSGDNALAKLKKEIAQSASRSPDEAVSKPTVTEHPLSQVSDFIKKWFVPVNAILAFMTFYVSYLGKLADPARVMLFTGLPLLFLAIFMALTSWSLKGTKDTVLLARYPKWGAFFNHKPITWLSFCLGLILVFAAYFVKAQNEPPKELTPAQSPDKAVPAPQIASSAPPLPSVVPAVLVSNPKLAPAASRDGPGTRLPSKPKPTPAISAQETRIPRNDRPPSKSSSTNPRCTSLLQKAGAGEPLTSQEQREMVSTCQ